MLAIENESMLGGESAPLYSNKAFDGLMSSLKPWGSSGEELVGFFTAYFDASGNSRDQPFLVAAGYVANGFQWKAFEEYWDRIHNEFDMKRPFHMVEFMSRNQPNNLTSQYARWAEVDPEAQDFNIRLCAAKQLLIPFGVSCIVPLSVYRDVSSAFDLEEVIPPYALAARTCVAAVHQWQVAHGLEDEIDCVFERGDFGQGKY